MAQGVREARLRIVGEDLLTKPVRQAGKAVAEFGKSAKVSAEVAKLTRALELNSRAVKDLDRYRKARADVASAEMAFKQAAARAEHLTKALAGARAESERYKGVKAGKDTAETLKKASEAARAVKELTELNRAAQRAVGATGRAVKAKSEALLTAKSAVDRYGVPIQSLTRHQDALTRSIEQTTTAIKRQEDVERRASEARRRQTLVEDARRRARAERREAVGVAATGAGVVAAYKGRQVAGEAIRSVAEFDIAVRKQQQFTDISDADQIGLLAQAKKIGQETQFSNIDVVQAQTAAMQGLPAGYSATLKAEVAKGIVENVRHYATLMETDLKEGAETIRSYLQTTGKDISTREKALDEARKATNQIVKMAKLGGMSGEDAAQYVKYASSSGATAGLSTDTLLTLGALARRGGLRGDEAGVFMRATASKLVAPTKKGLAALNAAGIDFNDYVKMPEKLSTSALEGQFQLEMGKGFTPEVRKRVDAINADKALISDREKYVEAVTSAVAPILGKKKDGTVRASDAQVAAKAAGTYHKVAAQSVDAERLLNDAMSKDMTLAQLNAWLTDKHGGKGAITQRQWDEFKAARAEIGKTGDDPDFARKRADAVMAGVGGAVENLKGSWENFVLNVGKANEGLIKLTADGIGRGLDAFARLDATSQQVLSLALGGGTVVAGGYGAGKLVMSIFGKASLPASALALDGSALALTKSAAALDMAALKLAGGSGGDITDKTTKAAAVGSAAAVASVVGVVGAGGVGASVVATEAVRRDPDAFVSNYLDPNYAFAGGILGGDQDPTKALADAYRALAAPIAAPDMAALRKERDDARAELARVARDRAALPAGRASLAAAKNLDVAERRARETLERVTQATLDAGLAFADALPGLSADLVRKAADQGRETGRSVVEGVTEGIDAKRTDAEAAGQATGEAVGQGVAEGVKAKVPAVIDEGRALLDGLKGVFDGGIAIPMRFALEGRASSGLIRASYGGEPLGAAEDSGGHGLRGLSESGGPAVRRDWSGRGPGAVSGGPTTDEGRDNVASWRSFMTRSALEGGMALPADKADAMVAMLQGESSPELDPRSVGDQGTSIGTAQWRDPTPGRGRATNLRRFAEDEGKDWRDRGVQQRFFKREMEGDYADVMARIRAAPTAEAALAEGVRGFERPARPDEAIAQRLDHLNRLRSERAGVGDAGSIPEGVVDLSGAANYRRGPLKSADGFVVHHTGGRGTAGGVVGTLNQRGLGVQYVMGRDGRIFRTLPEGARGAHMRPARDFPDAVDRTLSNANTIGMEVIAKDDRDVTKAQVESSRRFFQKLKERHPGIRAFGHGELNPGHKQATEGGRITGAIRADEATTPAAPTVTPPDQRPKVPDDRIMVRDPFSQPADRRDEFTTASLDRSIAGARRLGGPVKAGRSYRVGEDGEEIVTFEQDGHVLDARRSDEFVRNVRSSDRSPAEHRAASLAPGGLPAIGPALGDVLQRAPRGDGDPDRLERQSRGGDRSQTVNLGGITINAAPGQSPQAIAEAVADAVERRISAKLTSRLGGAFHDGVY